MGSGGQGSKSGLGRSHPEDRGGMRGVMGVRGHVQGSGTKVGGGCEES